MIILSPVQTAEWSERASGAPAEAGMGVVTDDPGVNSTPVPS
jgi:hypothetical protein